MDIPPIIPQVEQQPSRFSLWWVVVINGLEVLLTVQFYWVPRGTPIRPMGYALYIFMLALAGLAAIPMVLPTIWRRPRMALSWVVLFLALTPFPLARIMFWHAEKVCGFILEP